MPKVIDITRYKYWLKVSRLATVCPCYRFKLRKMKQKVKRVQVITGARNFVMRVVTLILRS